MEIMKKLILATFALFPFFLLADKSIKPESLEGIWIINHDNGKLDYSIIEYQANGDKCELAFSLITHAEITMYWNKWSLSGNVIRSTMHNTTSFIEYGFVIEDKIKTLDSDRLIVDMIAPYPGTTEFHYKNKDAKFGQVCDVVKKVFRNKSKKDFDTSQRP